MGGGEGDGDAMGAVMVDTSSAAQEWGRIQQQKKGKRINRNVQNPLLKKNRHNLIKKRLSVNRKFNDKKS